MMREIDKVIESNEQVLWEGKPKFWPFFLSSFGGIIGGFIFAAVGFFILLQGIKTGSWALILFPHFWIGLFIIFGAPIYRALVYSKTYYAITNKRVIFQRGVIGRDFEFIDFDQITNAQVNVGILDIIFGRRSGTIKISSAGAPMMVQQNATFSIPYAMYNLANPYDVFKFFKKVSHDVKTDINYPNKYRPKTNPGYQTGYKPR